MTSGEDPRGEMLRQKLATTKDRLDRHVKQCTWCRNGFRCSLRTEFERIVRHLQDRLASLQGPGSEQEARAAQVELIRILDRHSFYCAKCLDKQPCKIRDLWTTAINAAAVLAETARVVDGNDQEA